MNVYMAASGQHVLARAPDGGLTILDQEGQDAAIDATAVGENPYKGLESFDERDANRFFGRRQVIERLIVRYSEVLDPNAGDGPRLLAILGPSGSGKTSLARAGLIPELVRRPIPGLRDPLIAYMRPNVRPLWELALVLARIDDTGSAVAAAAGAYEDMLRRADPAADGAYNGLRRIADALAGAEARSLVVLVDQFEEIYTLAEQAEDARIFVSTLLDAARDRSRRVSVILTMRSDFLGSTIAMPELNAAISEMGVLVPGMSTDELREAIEAPARAAGRTIDSAVVDLLITETEGRPGALPLLQFALSRIWDGLAEGVEPAETLRQIGGVGGALAAVAEDLYRRLPPPDQMIARRAFLAMIRLGEGTRDTRRRAPTAEIVAVGEDQDRVKQVLDQFSKPDARLVTQGGDGERITVEVTHEALFEHWATLSEWVEESREDIRFQRQLNEAVNTWEDGGQSNGDLWRPPSLDRLADYARRNGAEMTQGQLAFYQASRRAHRRGAMFRVGGAVAAVLALIAVGFGLFAWEQRNLAEEQRARADELREEAQLIQSRFLADQSRQQRQQGSTTIAIGLALAALEDGRPVTADAQGALLEALVEHREEAVVPVGSESRQILGIAGGEFALIGDTDGHLQTVARLGSQEVFDIAVGTDGFLHASTPAEPGDTARPTPPAAGHPNLPQIAAGVASGGFAIHGLPNLALVKHLDLDIEDVEDMGFSRDGSKLFVVSSGNVHVVDTGSWTETARHNRTDYVLFPDAFDARLRGARSRYIMGAPLLVGADGSAAIATELGFQRYMRAVAVTPDGSRLFSVDLDGTPKLWLKGRSSSAWEHEPWVNAEDVRLANRLRLNTRLKIDLQVGTTGAGDEFILTGPDGVADFYRLGVTRRSTFQAMPQSAGPDLEATAASVAERSEDDFDAPSDADRNRPTAFDFTSDGKRLAIGSHVGAIAVYRTPGQGQLGEPWLVLRAGLERTFVHDLAFTADGQRLISLESDGNLRTWRMSPQWAPHVSTDLRSGMSSSAVSPDGMVAATAGYGVIHVFDIESGRRVKTLQEHQDWVHSLQFVDGGATLVSGSEDGRAIFWDVATGEPEKVLDTGHWETRVSPDGRTVVRMGEVGEVVVLARDTGRERHIPNREGREIYGVHFIRDTPVTLAFAERGARHGFEVIDLETEEVSAEARLPSHFASDLDEFWQYVIVGERIAIPTSTGSIALFHVDGTFVGELEGHPGHRIAALDFDGTGRALASVATDGSVRLWDVPSQQNMGTLKATTTRGRTIALSDDGRTLVVGFSRSVGRGSGTTVIWRRPAVPSELTSAANAIVPRELSSREKERFYVSSESIR